MNYVFLTNLHVTHFFKCLENFRFFVISGFLVAMILTKEDNLNATVIVMFYYKRYVGVSRVTSTFRGTINPSGASVPM